MATLVQDTFTGSDATAITAHTPDIDTVGGGWLNAKNLSTVSGTPANTIQGNQAKLGPDGHGVAIETNEADVVIEADWTPAVGVSNRNAIIVRYASDGNTWNCRSREENGDWQIMEINADTQTERASGAKTWTEGQTYALKSDVSGNSIIFYADETELGRYESATFNNTETKHGILRNVGNDASRFDNFLITGGGGTQFNQSVAGTLTSVGTVVKLIQTSKSGTLSSTGALIKQAQKSLSGTFTSAGTLIKQTRKSFAGTLTSSGVLSATKTALQAVGGVLSFSGSLIKQTQKSVSGSISSSGTLSKITSRILSGTLNFTGTITKRIGKSLSGALSFVGTLIASIVAPAAVSFPGKVSPSNSSIYDASGEDELTSNVVGSNTQRDGISISDSD